MPIRLTKKQYYSIIAGAVILIAGGIVSVSLWQNHAQVLDTLGNSLGNGRLPTTNDTPVPPRKPLESGEANHLSIPDRGIESPVIYVDEANEKVFQDALEGGVVHYPGTALPGEPGNPYIFGHSSDYAWKAGAYKQVLKPLVDIPVGTKVRITNPDGELFTYTVIETKIVGPKEVSVLDQYGYERTMLTLQTSWPVGTALKRFIAICELDEIATYGADGA